MKTNITLKSISNENPYSIKINIPLYYMKTTIPLKQYSIKLHENHYSIKNNIPLNYMKTNISLKTIFH